MIDWNAEVRKKAPPAPKAGTRPSGRVPSGSIDWQREVDRQPNPTATAAEHFIGGVQGAIGSALSQAPQAALAPFIPDPQARASFVSAAQQSPVGHALSSGIRTLSNALDVPLAYAEAIAKDVRAPAGQEPAFDQVTRDLQQGGIERVAENDVYFRQGSLQRVLDDPAATPQQKHAASFFLTHPHIAGLADFGTEFANPSNAIGGAVGRIAGAVARVPRVAQALDEAQALTRVGSRFAGLRVAARENAVHLAQAENWGRRLVGKGAAADRQAYDTAMDVFGGLTAEQQRAVIHRMQGQPAPSFGPHVDAQIAQRASHLADTMWQITRDQLREGVLDPSRVFGRDQLFPGVFDEFNNAFEARALTDAEQHEIVSRAVSGERPKPNLATMNLTPDNHQMLQARNDVLNARADTLETLLARDRSPSNVVHYFPMRGAFNDARRDEELADYLAHHTSSGGNATAIRRGTGGTNAPTRTFATLRDAEQQSVRGLDPNWVPAQSLYRFLAQRQRNVGLEQSMQELVGMGLAKKTASTAPGEHFVPASDVHAVRSFGSPSLRDEMSAHQHVVNFLNEVGASKDEASAFATATTALGKTAQFIGPSGPLWKGSSNLARMFVIANPIVHAGWNLMFQFLGAGGDLRDLAHLNDAMLTDAQRLGAAGERGAPLTLADGSAIEQASRPWSDLSPMEKVSRAVAGAQEWNAKVVFDRAERRYAAALYQTYVKRGMNPYEAANRVRQALGDYANVSNLGIDAALHKVFFFYPWLKTILPFWIKTGVTKPQTWNPAHRGVQTYNKLAGDPNADTGTEGPFTLYTGMVQGHPSYYAVPLPQRIIAQAADLGQGALTGNQQQLAKGAKGLFLNRLAPVPRAVAALTQTSTQPQNIVTGYAPILDRVTNVVAALGDYVPAPVQGAYHAARTLFGQEPFEPTVIAGDLIGGTGYVANTPTQAQQESHIKAVYYQAINAALKGGDKGRAWELYGRMQQALQAAGLQEGAMAPNPVAQTLSNPFAK